MFKYWKAHHMEGDYISFCSVLVWFGFGHQGIKVAPVGGESYRKTRPRANIEENCLRTQAGAEMT